MDKLTVQDAKVTLWDKRKNLLMYKLSGISDIATARINP
jgi:hypothetical protein